MLHLQPVCSVVRQWSQDKFGQRRLRMSSGCKPRSDCTPGWTSWPYTDQNIHSNDVNGIADSSRGSDNSDSSRSFQNSDVDYRDTTTFRYNHHYRYATSHRSCPATSCRPPTGELGHLIIMHTA